MTRRQRNIGILLAVFLLILILLILLLIRFWPSEPEIERVVTPEVPEQTSPTETQTPIQRQQAEERENTASLQTTAKTFVERYGSYSNESDFANLRDLFPLMTAEFQAETEAFIASTTIPENYYGITTRVITVQVDALDEAAGTSTITMTTQREEAIDSPQNVSVRYQEITLTLVRQAGSWLVSSAEWK